MAKFDYKRPGDEQTLEGGGGGGGGGYSSQSKISPGDVGMAGLAAAMAALGVAKGNHDNNEAAKLGADPRFVDPEYSHEGLNYTKNTKKAKGGQIKKMASGGMTSKASSASKRADGIAQRGKTKGRMC